MRASDGLECNGSKSLPPIVRCSLILLPSKNRQWLLSREICITELKSGLLKTTNFNSNAYVVAQSRDSWFIFIFATLWLFSPYEFFVVLRSATGSWSWCMIMMIVDQITSSHDCNVLKMREFKHELGLAYCIVAYKSYRISYWSVIGRKLSRWNREDVRIHDANDELQWQFLLAFYIVPL